MAVNNQGPGGMASAAQALKGILNDTVGPMAALTAGALAFVKYTAGAALNAEKMAAALRASAEAKGLESQFKAIMGSADAARKKVAELSKEAAKSPFSFQALGKAALNLQVLSNGAFASSRALKQVQDIAVATGTPIDAVAAAMGELVGSMKRGGAGAGEAAAQLAAMGAISQAAAQKVADLAAQGAPAGEAMRLVESETSKAKGAAADLASTISGLTQQMENLQTASDAKIGAMFEEGEKAGLRAAMGFQKFGNAVAEVAAAPWASILGSINSVKEAAGNALASMVTTNPEQSVKVAMEVTGTENVDELRELLDGTDDKKIAVALEATGLESVQQLRDALDGVGQPAEGVKTAVTAMYAVAGAILLKLAKDAFGLAAALVNMVGGWAAVGKATGGAAATLARWAGLASVGQAAGLALAAGFLYVAQNALSAARAIEEMNAALEKQMGESYETQSKFRGKAASVRTSDDRRGALQEIDTEIEAKQKDLRDKQAAAAAAREKSDTMQQRWEGAIANGDLGGLTLAGTRTQAAAAAQAAEAAAGIAQTDVMGLQAQRARIAANVDSTGRSRGPLGLGREQDQKARERMDLEKQIRDDAYASAQGAADPVMQAKMARAELRRAEERSKKAEEASKVNPEERAALEDATAKVAPGEANAEKLRQGIEGIKGVKATTESSKLSRDIAVRDTLARQRQEIETQSGQNLTVEQRSALDKRRQVVDEQVAALGGNKEISGGRIQELERQRDFAVTKEDSNSAAAATEAARNQAQAGNEAEAAQKSLIAAKQKTLALENQLAGIADDGANAEAKVTAESENRAGALRKALAAAQALEAAQAKFAQARESGTAEQQDKARTEVDKASVAAAAAGTEGRGVAEIQSALQIEQQILQANLNQAKITQAAAQARVEAAQRQLNTERMMAQMNIESAEANVKNTDPKQSKTAAAIKSEAADAEIAALDRKLAAAKEREAAEKAVADEMKGGGTASVESVRRLEEANRAAAQAGVGSQTSADIQTERDRAGVSKADQEAQRIDAAQTEAERVKLANLRAQEAYGSNPQAAKKEADALEDNMAKEARTKELGKVFKDPAIAAQMADLEVQQSRASSNIAEMGQPRMSEMASVGGSAGWGGLVSDPTKEIKKLQEINNKINAVLDKINTTATEGLNASKAAIAAAQAQ